MGNSVDRGTKGHTTSSASKLLAINKLRELAVNKLASCQQAPRVNNWADGMTKSVSRPSVTSRQDVGPRVLGLFAVRLVVA